MKWGQALPLTVALVMSAPAQPSQPEDPVSGGWVDHFDLLDNDRWCISSSSYVPFWAKDGLSGSWNPAAVSVESGHLVLRTTVQNYKVAAAETYTCQSFGFGTYEALVLIPALNGMISAMMSYVDGSQTEIDFEFEGRDVNALHAVTWTSPDTKQHSLHVHATAFPGVWTSLRYEWGPTGVEFFVNDVLVAQHRDVVPSAAARVVFNVWPTNNPEWGGPSTDGAAVMRVDWVRFTPLGSVGKADP
ncbi:glycoside hydrolase family 16 protein [Teichococcus oryzae]|uniref:Glycoside hydrolase family 16 protein n=1 Tax=Teichococcus oryzae TaxID=1608942 RepID=A0A5B2T9M3_9PROT|nr:glycoside hydrolase family 16 protein [Pseudoroseomonas oryzae]KAA2211326.1 glycoside hydrolase family 16 protein [Pseudoroseomonas oryzae]